MISGSDGAARKNGTRLSTWSGSNVRFGSILLKKVSRSLRLCDSVRLILAATGRVMMGVAS